MGAQKKGTHGPPALGSPHSALTGAWCAGMWVQGFHSFLLFQQVRRNLDYFLILISKHRNSKNTERNLGAL